jgi:hypothetical protein
MFYKQEMLKNHSITKCKVTWIGSTAGKRYGQPECNCELSINGKKEIRKYDRKDLKLNIGDCLEVIYSIEDPTVSSLDYNKGPVPCQ